MKFVYNFERYNLLERSNLSKYISDKNTLSELHKKHSLSHDIDIHSEISPKELYDVLEKDKISDDIYSNSVIYIIDDNNVEVYTLYGDEKENIQNKIKDNDYKGKILLSKSGRNGTKQQRSYQRNKPPQREFFDKFVSKRFATKFLDMLITKLEREGVNDEVSEEVLDLLNNTRDNLEKLYRMGSIDIDSLTEIMHTLYDVEEGDVYPTLYQILLDTKNDDSEESTNKFISTLYRIFILENSSNIKEVGIDKAFHTFLVKILNGDDDIIPSLKDHLSFRY